jgi:hypothetical protein
MTDSWALEESSKENNNKESLKGVGRTLPLIGIKFSRSAEIR